MIMKSVACRRIYAFIQYYCNINLLDTFWNFMRHPCFPSCIILINEWHRSAYEKLPLLDCIRLLLVSSVRVSCKNHLAVRDWLFASQWFGRQKFPLSWGLVDLECKRYAGQSPWYFLFHICKRYVLLPESISSLACYHHSTTRQFQERNKTSRLDIAEKQNDYFVWCILKIDMHSFVGLPSLSCFPRYCCWIRKAFVNEFIASSYFCWFHSRSYESRTWSSACLSCSFRSSSSQHVVVVLSEKVTDFDLSEYFFGVGKTE